jgi:hypothetical protein
MANLAVTDISSPVTLKMTIRYQRGHLRCTKRKNGPSVREFLWRENDATGKRLRRTAVIGTVEQYPNEDLALSAVNGLMVSINDACNRQRSRSILFGDLTDHYEQTELCDRSEWYSEATKVIYAEFDREVHPSCGSRKTAAPP